ncbi:MAG: glutaredoxin family protein [Pseudomonadales bacterium]
MQKIKLYTTVGCHLCEQALALLQQAREGSHGDSHEFEICEVEISDSESLMAAYGVRIPVIRFDDGQAELGWPFTYQDLQTFLANGRSS